MPLLHDRDGSRAWSEWHARAGIPCRSTRNDLVIPDPNVRVQAVIDNQGVALNDALVAEELERKQLHKISSIELEDYGYFLVYPDGALSDPKLSDFRDWIIAEAQILSS